MTPPLVAILAYDQLCTFEYGCAVEIFGLPRPELGQSLYECVTFSCKPGAMRAMGGLTISASHGLEILDRAHTVVVPGWRDTGTGAPAELISGLVAAHNRGARIMSICSGVLLLAEAGLLNGMRATTHWQKLHEVTSRYPDISIEGDVLYVDEGSVLTSAGSAAGLDLCMHVVRKDYGPDVANAVARRLVLPTHREGGQRQYVPSPVMPSDRADSLGDLLDELRHNITKHHTVKSMAEKLGTSERTLFRRFRAGVGMSPAEWLVQERLRQARDLLETSREPVEHVAERCGFGSVESFRHHFRRVVHTSPSNYRREFSRLTA